MEKRKDNHMKKKEFLNKLYEALSDNMSEKEASTHIDYYKAYIEGQCSNGRNEKEVIEELGNPRLIAKTIIGTSSSEDNKSKYTANDESDSYGYENYSRNQYNNDYDKYGKGKKKKSGIFLNSNLTLKQKLKLLAVLAIVLLIIGAMFMSAISLLIAFVRLVIKFIVPLSIIIGAYYIYKIIKE